MGPAQTEADEALLRAELANLDVDPEATNLQVATHRAETVDDPALSANDATWIKNSRSGVKQTCGIGVPSIKMACKVWLQILVGAVLHLASSEANCLDVLQLLQRASEEEEE